MSVKNHVNNKKELRDIYLNIVKSQYSIFKKYMGENDHPFVLFYLTITDNAQHFLFDRPELLLEVFYATFPLLYEERLFGRIFSAALLPEFLKHQVPETFL